jgi:crotonobetaine/carnitine-CoA ligase
MRTELTLTDVHEALTRGRIAVGICNRCGHQQSFPSPACFACSELGLWIAEHSGAAAVFATVENHHAIDAKADDLPRTVILAQLDGGGRVYGRLRSTNVVGIDDRVALDRHETAEKGFPVYIRAPDDAVDAQVADGVPDRTVFQIVRDHKERCPDALAFQLLGFAPLTYADLLSRVESCAGWLLDREVRPGDRVGVMSNNRPEILEVWLACSRIGAVFVPLNTAFRGQILADLLALAEPALVVCEPEWEERIASAAPQLRREILAAFGEQGWTKWVSSGRHPWPEEPAPNDLGLIMFTSGTTGRSKGVMWSHLTMLGMAWSFGKAMELRPTDRLHSSLPMFHGNALMLTVLTALVLGSVALLSRRFSASSLVSELESCGATMTSLLGSMCNMILKHRTEQPFSGRLEKTLVIPAPAFERRQIEEWLGCRVVTAYGISEAGMPIYGPDGFPEGSCGKPYEPLWEGRIVDENRRELPASAVGELAVRPRRRGFAAMGYWRMPEATAALMTDGWILTGDVMRRDQDGYFHFLDRAKDAIRRSGENISSQEVEMVFNTHPAVLECAAYPVPSELTEDEVMLAVVLKPGVTVSALDLIRFAEGNLPYFAIPRFVRFIESLPKNQLEKILKIELRRAGAETADWDRHASGYRLEK